MSTTEVITGTVEARNATGIRVNGEWRTLSKFRPIELPGVGSQVTCEVDAKGFLTRLEVLGQDSSPATESDQARQTRRQLAITIAAQLVGAFAQTHEPVKVEHIFPLADRLLEWLEQS